MDNDARSTYRLKDLPDMARVVEIRLARAEFDQMVRQEIGRYARKVHTRGFRPGKTPPDLVARQYGEEINDRVRERLLNECLRRAVAEHKLSLDGQIESQLKEAPGDGHAGVYEVSFEVLPDFDPRRIEGLQCQLVRASVNQDDIDDALEDLRGRYTQWRETALASTDGHQVSFRYTMTVDAKPITAPGQDTMRMSLVLGEKHILEDLPAQLRGVRPGDHKRVETRFPDSFSGPDLAGKVVVFEIDVEKVCAPEVPEIDDEFARRIDPGSTGRSALIETISQYLSGEAGRLSRAVNRHRLRQLLLRHFDLPLPPGQVQRNTEARLAALKRPGPGRGAKAPDINPGEVGKRVRQDMILGVIFSELARHHRCRPERERVSALVREDAQITKNPRATYQKIIKSASERRRYENIVVEDMVFDHIIEAVGGEYEEVSLRRLRELAAGPAASPLLSQAQP